MAGEHTRAVLNMGLSSAKDRDGRGSKTSVQLTSSVTRAGFEAL